ncbi:hypothetical protein GH733_009895, partial [Mirounga leonina]
MERAEPGLGGWDSGAQLPATPPRRCKGPGGREIALAGRAQPLARRSLSSQGGESAGPEAEPPSCRRVSLPPSGGERRAPCCPPSAPPPRGLRLIFPAGKRRAADKGMPVRCKGQSAPMTQGQLATEVPPGYPSPFVEDKWTGSALPPRAGKRLPNAFCTCRFERCDPLQSPQGSSGPAVYARVMSPTHAPEPLLPGAQRSRQALGSSLTPRSCHWSWRNGCATGDHSKLLLSKPIRDLANSPNLPCESLPANSAGSWWVASQPIGSVRDRRSHSDFQRRWVLALPKVRKRLGTRFRRCDWLRRDLPHGVRRKKRKRGASHGPCRSHSHEPDTAPAPPPSPEPTRPAWTGMGLRAAPSCAAAAASAAAAGAEQRRRPQLCPPPLALLLLLLLSLGLLHAGDCQQPAQCRIQKCTTDFVSLTSHLNSAVDGFDSEFCKALRAYAGCTQRTSKACRGNLVYHSAVLGISDLMSQRNCSKDGPTSSTNPEVTHDPCNYHSHAGAREHRGGDLNPPSYLFCGLFGDPHLRTFKDHFQTCKVEGAWPLIDNNYLSVQVTNVPVVPGSSATATNKA